MQVVDTRLVEMPDISLIAVATPVARRTLGPTVQDRFVLALVVRAPEREGVLGPDDEGRPLAAGGAEGGLQGVEF